MFNQLSSYSAILLYWGGGGGECGSETLVASGTADKFVRPTSDFPLQDQYIPYQGDNENKDNHQLVIIYVNHQFFRTNMRRNKWQTRRLTNTLATRGFLNLSYQWK